MLLIAQKTIRDTDGFTTDYSWYFDGTQHIFMYGDSDIYEPDIEYADWISDTYEQAEEWFNNYETEE